MWPLDLTGDGRSELVTRSTFGTGVPYVFVYRWNAAEGISQHSGIVWEKADAQLAKLSAPLGSVARAETYHAEDNTVTLTLYTEGGTREVTLPLTTDILACERLTETIQKGTAYRKRFLLFFVARGGLTLPEPS